MKRVAIITNIPAPYRVDFFDYLKNNYKEYEFIVIYSSANEDNRSWEMEKEKLESSIFLESKTIKIKNNFDPKYIHIPWGVGKVLKKIAPDVVVASEYNPTVIQALSYCKRKKIPFVSWTDGTLFSERNINFVQKFLRKYVIANASSYIASSTKSKEAQIAYGASEEKCHISLLTVDVNKYIQEPQGKGNGKILCVGRLENLKGIDLLLKALKNVREEFELYLAGDGDAEQSLKELTKELELTERVHFLGQLGRNELLKHYADSDLFILPTRQDCFALVILEAMCSGLPIICSKYAEGAPDMIEEGENGYIIDPYDEKAFSECIESVLGASGLQNEMKKKSDQMIEKFRFENVAKGYLEAIEDGLREKDRNK